MIETIDDVKTLNKGKKMNKLHKKKRFITLVEMMIVMFLIAMITGVIAYNYTGSLEEGKAFKTKNGIDKIHTVLDLHLIANPNDRDSIESSWKDYVKKSQIVKNADELTKDGWGGEYQVTKGDDDEIIIRSDRYQAYKNKQKGSLFGDSK
jgi:general secretion pathway protein G